MLFGGSCGCERSASMRDVGWLHLAFFLFHILIHSGMGRSKELVTLQVMDHFIGGEDSVVQIVHVVDEIRMGGEFTMCGCAIPDSTLSQEGFESVGSEFKGTVSQSTCSSCRDFVRYVQSMKWR